MRKNAPSGAGIWGLLGLLMWMFVVGVSAQEGGGGFKVPLPPDGSGEIEFVLAPVGIGEDGAARVFRSGDSVSGLEWDRMVEGSFSRETKGGREWFYYMGKCEVTRGQWAGVMGLPRPVGEEAEWPKTGVSWFEAQEFLRRCNEWLLKRKQTPSGPDGKAGVLRLPTEAEWEYAARGGAGDEELQSKGDPYRGQLDAHEWHRGNSNGRLQPVGRKQPNGYGLCDMLGDAQEMMGEAFRVAPGWGPVGGVTLRGGDAWTAPGGLSVRRRGELSWNASRAEAERVGFRVVIGLSEASGQKELAEHERARKSVESAKLEGLLARSVRDEATPAEFPDRIELTTPNGLERVGFRAVRVGREGKGAEDFWGSDSLDPNQPGGRHMEGEWKVSVGGSFHDTKGWIYYIGEKEVSRDQWRNIMGGAEAAGGTNDGALPASDMSWQDVQIFLEKYNRWLRTSAGGGSRLPRTVRGETPIVRLPTEAEWEYAARGGAEVSAGQFAAERLYPLEQTSQYESAYRGGERSLSATGSRKANPLGLYDMLGNVSEMTQGWFQAAPGVGRIGGVCVRGGSAWYDAAEALRASLRIERRLYDEGTGAPARSVSAGFRLALGVPWLISPGPDAATTGQSVVANQSWRQARYLFGLIIIGMISAWALKRWAGKHPADLPVQTELVQIEFQETAEVGKSYRNSIGAGMVWIAPGGFKKMADAESGYSWEVLKLELTSGYWLGGTAVTQAQWETVMGSSPSHFKAPNRPVDSVSWGDANAYCKALSEREHVSGRLPDGMEYRLPAEAQWEYACRAGNKGDRDNGIDAVAWYWKNSGDQTHEVKRKRPNAWGLYDMLGNVWEWCGDRYDSHGSQTTVDPPGLATRESRVLHGGSWWRGDANFLRSSSREFRSPGSRDYRFGFRCALIVCGGVPSSAQSSGPPVTASDPSLKTAKATPARSTPRRAPVSTAIEAARSQIEFQETAEMGKSYRNSIGTGMVWIAPGSFKMGDQSGKGDFDEKPVHEVRLTSGFWIAESQVTQAQWKAIIGGNSNYFNGPNLPVTSVNWEEANAYCKALSEREHRNGRLPVGMEYRLPTEAQWEYACRAGNTGDTTKDIGTVAWYWENSDGRTHEVKGKRPNAWGLYDMLGNVWEWCADWHGIYPEGKVVDPAGPESGQLRVVRGGSWYRGDENCLRSSSRESSSPAVRNYIRGFRCVLAVCGGAPSPSEPSGLPAATLDPSVETAKAPQTPPQAPHDTIITLIEATPLPIEFQEKPEMGKGYRNRFGLGMVWIAPGSFKMGDQSGNGDSDEKPLHEVRLTSGYWMAESQVTQSQWEAVTGSNPSNFRGSNLPVETVSWEDATAYCRALSHYEHASGLLPAGMEYRLPTEAQWEYACRAGSNADRPKEFDSVAWYGKNSGGRTHDAKGKQPNAWGLYDMHGNVWEWCADRYGAYGTETAVDPTGPGSGNARVLRGGSWDENSGVFLRPSYRALGSPTNRFDGGGFRCVLVVAGG